MKILNEKLFLYLICNLAITSSQACTTVFSNDNGIAPVVARTVDLFKSDQPLIVVIPRAQEHNGQTKNTLHWKSKYGSVAVTAFHSYAVSDGINEKGLVAHLLYLSGTQYPKVENKPTISNLMWGQYILDNYSTVTEALNKINDLQIEATAVGGKTWPLHLALEDNTGDSAIVEYIDGKMKIYHGKQYTVMTNEPEYSIQLENLKKYQGFGGKLPLPGDPDPLSRFVRVATFLKTLPKPATNLEAIANVLSVIRTAMVPFGAVDTSDSGTEDAWATRWVSVADIKNKIYYFNSTTAPNIVWIDLNKLDFTNNKVLSLDPTDITLKGEINSNLH